MRYIASYVLLSALRAIALAWARTDLAIAMHLASRKASVCVYGRE